MAGRLDLNSLTEESIEHVDEPTLKKYIAEFKQESQRRQDRISREHERLRALNGELAARKEEHDRYRRELQELSVESQEREENKIRTKAARRDDHLVRLVHDDIDEKRDVQDKVRTCVEQQLEDALKRRQRSKKNELGIRLFDEMELMVDKPPAEQVKEGKVISTVMIVFAKNSEARSYLSYRVDASKPAQDLLQDACLYWGLSEVEYVLKTQQGSKVHDYMRIQNCFRDDEEALLTLIQKNPKQTRLLPEEMESIKGSKKKGQKRAETGKVQAEESASLEKEDDDEELEQQMINKKQYGLWEFLTQWRDQEVKGHLEHIRLRNMLIYLIVAILLMVSLLEVMKPNDGFFCRDGVLLAMAEERVVHTKDGTDVHVPQLSKIRTQEESWTWLKYMVSAVLLSENSDLRQNDYLPGRVHVRMQMVSPPSHDTCTHKDDLQGGIACTDRSHTSDTAYKAEFPEVVSYWSGVAGQAGREGNPGQHVEETPGHAGWVEGSQQSYGTSGYFVSYDMQSAPLAETRDAYLADMDVLRDSWLNERTRAIHVTFLAYNGNYDYWISNHFLFEMPAIGVVESFAKLEVFKPVVADSPDGWQVFAVDTIVLVVVVTYIGVYQLVNHNNLGVAKNEALHKAKQEIEAKKDKDAHLQAYAFDPPWFKHEHLKAERTRRQILLSGNNLIDAVGIACMFIVVYTLRYIVPLTVRGSTLRYRDDVSADTLNFDRDGHMFQVSLLMQSVVLACVLWRWYGFLKLNRYIFLIFKTISESLKVYSKFGLVLLPVLLSFVFSAHQIWKPYVEGYRTFWASSASYLVRLVGDKDSARMAEVQRPVTVFFSVGSYIVVKLILLQSWIAGLVQTYQRVRVTSGYKPEEKGGPYHWTEEDYVDTMMLPLPKRIYKWLRNMIKRPSAD